MEHSDKRRLLLISYLFPPAGGVAVQRALSLAKYLPRSNYQVTVLSASNPSTPVVDRNLESQIPPGVRVERVFTPEIPFQTRQKLWAVLQRLASGFGTARGGEPAGDGATKPSGRLTGLVQQVFCPDPEVVWKPFALRAARKIVRRDNIGTVLVTAPPFSAFLTGVALKRQFPHLRLVSDFRDSWLNFYLSQFEFLRNDSVRRRSIAMERMVVEHSDLVVTVTPSIVEELRGRYGHLDPARFATVVNGYDPEMFASFRPRPHGTGKIVVSYLGTLYPASSARYYLRALESLPAGIAARFETRFFGRVTGQEKTILDQHQASAIRVFGFQPQAEAFRKMEETDFVLITMTDAASLTGKILEYVAMNKPVLAFSPIPGEVSRILGETGAGWCAPVDEVDAGRRMLLRAVDLMDGRQPALTPDRVAIQQYDRIHLAALYAQLMDGIPAQAAVRDNRHFGGSCPGE